MATQQPFQTQFNNFQGAFGQAGYPPTNSAFLGNTGFTGRAYSAIPPQAATLFNSSVYFPPGARMPIQDTPQFINNYQPYNPNSRPVQGPGSRGYGFGGQRQSYGFGPGAGRLGYEGAYGYQDSFSRQGWINNDFGFNDGGYDDYGFGGGSYGRGNDYSYYDSLLDDKALADLAFTNRTRANTRSSSSDNASLLADLFRGLGLGATSISTPAPAPAASTDGLGDLNALMAFLNGTSNSPTGSTSLASASGGSAEDQIAGLLDQLGLNT